MTNTATLSIAQVDSIARAIIPLWQGYPTPTPSQIKVMTARYCDDPSITAADRNRICIRIEQHFNL